MPNDPNRAVTADVRAILVSEDHMFDGSFHASCVHVMFRLAVFRTHFRDCDVPQQRHETAIS